MMGTPQNKSRNDYLTILSEIRIWTFRGDTLHTLSGHTSFIYSLSVLPSGDLVSGGEDRGVRIWKDGLCIQTIVHPALSVWAVSTMPNGDIVSGCSDGVVRVFSASEDRWASDEDLKAFEKEIANQTLSRWECFVCIGMFHLFNKLKANKWVTWKRATFPAWMPF
jgi:WD40 repeat protein